jgi:hypothetical protein
MVEQWRLPLVTSERYAFTEPTSEGIEYIAENLRTADREEGFATFGHHRHLDAIRLSVAASQDVVMGVTAYGEPAALIGVATMSVLYSVGCPWMLATDAAYRYRRAFIECGRAYTHAMLNQYDKLTNHVDARNVKNVAWLQRMGYQIGEPEPFGALGMPFHPFTIERR